MREAAKTRGLTLEQLVTLASIGERRRATHAYLTFVAIDEHGRPKKVPPLEPKGPEGKKLLAEAEKRRKRRLELGKMTS